MALIKCKECGKEISDLAASCPHCGAPLKAASTAPQPNYQQQVVDQQKAQQKSMMKTMLFSTLISAAVSFVSRLFYRRF
ncbi:MAG: zinc-ribbon domain-containing protein [Bacteroidales bacterium]|jgi:predicted amidophosphoribosyltransferase|nr:zinc-ribbon domain-containing protein [Bacteroidales bacterium]MBR0314311.1 zinc-ribbon domain-containing protein [Bacteroidales bacterium]